MISGREKIAILLEVTNIEITERKRTKGNKYRLNSLLYELIKQSEVTKIYIIYTDERFTEPTEWSSNRV